MSDLICRFEERHGSSLCRDLLGEDMSTEEGERRIREQRLTEQICPGLVRSAAEILTDLFRWEPAAPEEAP